MYRQVKVLLVAIAAIAVLAACSSAPNAKVSEARSLIDSVVAAGGEEFAPEKIQSLNRLFDEALAEIKTQDSVVFKNYSLAEYTLNQIMDECDELKSKMAASKGEQVVAYVKRNKFAAD